MCFFNFNYFEGLNFIYDYTYSNYDRFVVFSDSEYNPPITKPDGSLMPLRNNVAGKMTGLELILKSLITEYFPSDKRSKGYNVWEYCVFKTWSWDDRRNIIFLYVYYTICSFFLKCNFLF